MTFKFVGGERLRQDEKESRKMQDSLQMLQLKFAACEQLCRNLQEKVYIQETSNESFPGFDIILRTRRVFTHGFIMFGEPIADERKA